MDVQDCLKVLLNISRFCLIEMKSSQDMLTWCNAVGANRRKYYEIVK